MDKKGESEKWNVLAVVGFFSGLAGFSFNFFPLMIVAFILGIISYKQIKKSKVHGKYLSLWSIIVGGLFVSSPVIGLLWAFFISGFAQY